MSFLTDILARIEPSLTTEHAVRAIAAYRANPSEENFGFVAEHVAHAASPEIDPEMEGRFTAAVRPSVAAEFFYIALTERVLGATGWLNRAITKSDRSRGDWLDDRHLLQRAGVSRKM